MREKSGCGIYLFIIFLNLSIGAWSVNEILSWTGTNIPFIADMVIGLFLAELTIPIAIIGAILQACGVF